MQHVTLTRREDGVAVVVLDQPEKKNAISAPMMDRLCDLLEEADADPEVRVVVLRGAGDVFSSGGDLSQGGPDGPTVEQGRSQLRRYLRAIRTVRRIGTPVIAMVDGYAVGGAFSLVLACDLVCVSDRARAIPAFCALGIVPEMGIMKLLPELVGEKAAKEILFTNRTLYGEDLARMGVANRVLAPELLWEGTLELALAVAAMPALGIQVTKGIMNGSADVGLDAVLEAESTASPFCAQTAEHKELAARFRAGRQSR
ncbi:enoyl-CoA hydratase/isomerase family protein [Actinotalea sp. M2MS4P-6]|uniref:enoyl-CoA hydratase/isomerase family protein n=1 Tax=Actinotalea sp. M2MS4P-6 TaxID=2983762 RepID=UPI0021E44829|nr:enoyl-CoA hydratase/isomerase family protein [Actinotalea sp. M2MS4P-6]MCV2394282.1 enoyl-CoA hydratase/isomerase family protein [Actinotalea sp. M2MS4P-6]